MQFVGPFDPVSGAPQFGVDAPYSNGDSSTGVEGSIIPGEAIEHVMREMCHAIDFYLGDGTFGSGQAATLTQLREAIETAVAGGSGGGFLPLSGGNLSGNLGLNTGNLLFRDGDGNVVGTFAFDGGIFRWRVEAGARGLFEGNGSAAIAGIDIRTATGIQELVHFGNLAGRWTRSDGDSGYRTDPDGWIKQWMRVTSPPGIEVNTTLAFPIAFPTACRFMHAEIENATSDTVQAVQPQIVSRTLTDFTYRLQSIDANATNASAITWIAEGH